VAAGQQVTVNLQNNDATVDHDFGVSIAGAGKASACTGPCRTSVRFVAPAGTYPFFCSIHIEMVGELVAR
jgi:hypothetical protein